MKRLFLLVSLLSFFMVNSYAQLFISNSEQFFISSGETFHYDGLTLSPTANFTLSNTTLTLNSSVNHSTVNSYVQRVYLFSNPISGFIGTARIDYLESELNTVPEANMQMIYHDGIDWNSLNTSSADASTNYFIGSSNSSLAINELTLTSALSILPVHWLKFNGALNGENVLLDWSVSEENNVKEYNIEHSTEKTTWKNIGKIYPYGKAGMETRYSFTHTKPSNGKNYYRITEVDKNGSASRSKIIHVSYTQNLFALHAFPNPVTGGFINVKLAQPSLVKIIKSSGEIIFNKPMDQGIQRIEVQQLTPGIYRLNAQNETISFIKL